MKRREDSGQEAGQGGHAVLFKVRIMKMGKKKLVIRNQRKIGTAAKRKEKRNRGLNKRLLVLEAALRKYGEHLGPCYVNIRMGHCNCGFEQALKGNL